MYESLACPELGFTPSFYFPNNYPDGGLNSRPPRQCSPGWVSIQPHRRSSPSKGRVLPHHSDSPGPNGSLPVLSTISHKPLPPSNVSLSQRPVERTPPNPRSDPRAIHNYTVTAPTMCPPPDLVFIDTTRHKRALPAPPNVEGTKSLTGQSGFSDPTTVVYPGHLHIAELGYLMQASKWK